MNSIEHRPVAIETVEPAIRSTVGLLAHAGATGMLAFAREYVNFRDN
jgi:hypothetical protein